MERVRLDCSVMGMLFPLRNMVWGTKIKNLLSLSLLQKNGTGSGVRLPVRRIVHLGSSRVQ
jgi:hypothetical protein